MSDLLDSLERDDGLPLFARVVGFPLMGWQERGLGLETYLTVIVGARQVGKSRALAVLASWWALRRPGQTVLIVSNGELGARRLLGQVRDVLASPALRADVLEEAVGSVVLVNGSRIIALPKSSAIRGHSVDLLLCDEAAEMDDATLEGSAIPTTTARVSQGARVVLAGTPWQASGGFYRYAMAGEQGLDPTVRTFRWRIADALTDVGGWVSRQWLAQRKLATPQLQFRAEYECEFIDGGAGYFSRDDLVAAAAPYELLEPEDAPGGNVVMGLDWGRRVDSHAIALLAVADDYDRNELAPLFLPWYETSQRGYADQVDLVATIAGGGRLFRGRATLPGPTRGRTVTNGPVGYDVATIYSETNGVGGPATEALEDRVGWRVVPVSTTQESKERDFGRLLSLVISGQMVLPDHPKLLRELSALEATPTETGRLRIAAAGTGHDDLAMAISFTMRALDTGTFVGTATSRRTGELMEVPMVTTPSGLVIPKNPQPRRDGLTNTRSVLRVQ
ncbi:MAG: terminase family protein [Nocardioides sp.]